MTPQHALSRLIDRREIFQDEMLSIMRQIMSGQLTPVQVAGIIIGLRVKGETVEEIAAAAEVLRELSVRVDVSGESHLVDTCGTGGDEAHTFNISTTSAFVAAAAGVKIAKHGGRSVSSSCGSADVLEALGVNVNLTPEQVAQSIHHVGIGFMFAPNYHSAMKHAAKVRKELGVRTLFNILGPLTNPAGARNQVLGVFHHDLVGIQARVLQALGSRHVLVVHGLDGLDEISVSGKTEVAELKSGNVDEYTIDPTRYGIKVSPLNSIQAKTISESKDMLLSVLDNKPGPARDIVILNSGAAIYVSGLTHSLDQGVKKASDAIASGAARAKLHELAEFSKVQIVKT